jgi:pimeloyl-ACP methyl ester carboxylesterase
MARTRRRPGRFQAAFVAVAAGTPDTLDAGRPGKQPRVRDVAELSDEIAGLQVTWREAGSPSVEAPVLYVHGVPTNADLWLPFLERVGGYAPDLPGFGRSDKPADFDYSPTGYAKFLESYLEHVGVERYSLVVHDWGGVGLALAQRAPERVRRLVVMDTVPLLPGYRWHRVARLWRTPVVGELTMGFTFRFGVRRAFRRIVSDPEAADRLTDLVWRHFDHGTQRAILRLYRSASPTALEQAGERLGEIVAPALVLWGERDPFIPREFAQRYADALGGQTTVNTISAGHWLWLDQPDVVDTVKRFLESA